MSVIDEDSETTTREIGTPRRVLVTGGASGLGAAVVELLSAHGDRVTVLDRAVPPTRPGTDADIRHLAVDLSDTRWAEQTVEMAIDDMGGCDALVTCAGTDSCGLFDEVDAASWEHVIAVNLLGTAAVARAALPALRESGGRIVTVASTLGLRALPAATAYCASKFGVIGFSRALAAETQGRPGVTCLVPGGMSTAFFDGRPDQYKPAPDQALNRPQDVAEVVRFALTQPQGCELREIIVCPSTETSWP
jgi:NAD(P)-dependent dehydrogenase (short-subunit alcohol dehydrogenase family)